VAIGVLVYYVVAFWPGRALGAVRIVRLLLLAAILQSAMAIVEWGNGWNLWHDTSWQQAGDVRAIGTLGNPALTGAFIGVGIVAALAILCWTGPAELHRLAAVMVIVGLPALYATKTRGPILATVVASLLCVVLSSRSRLAALGTVALVALVVVALWPEIRSSSVYRNRIDERQNVDARLVLQQVSITLAERRPLLGYGYDSFDRVKLTVPAASGAINPGTALQSTSHDTFLTMLVEFGAVGLILFVVPWLVVVGRAVRRALVPSPDRWLTVAAISGILVIAVTGATLDYRFFSFIPMLGWLLLGLLRRQIAAEA
jgi:O-antigen ligase